MELRINTEETNTDWLDEDSDDDGYSDYDEIWHNGKAGYQFIINPDTNPNNADSDGDGLLDGDEVHIFGYDPRDVDSDDNGINDAHEDFDGDGLANTSDPLPIDFNFQDGDMDASTTVNAADILIIQRIALGLLPPTLTHYQHGDMAPLGTPDGTINLGDILLVTKKALEPSL